MDNNQTIPLLLTLVIVALYYLYRIKKKKLLEEEQKYIDTFLLKDQDISLVKTGSPFKIASFSASKPKSHQEIDFYSKIFESPKSNRNSVKAYKKGSPSSRLSTSLQGKLSPLGAGEIFHEKIYNVSPKETFRKREFAKEIIKSSTNLETIKLTKIPGEIKIETQTASQKQNESAVKKSAQPKTNLNLKFQEMEKHSLKNKFDDDAGLHLDWSISKQNLDSPDSLKTRKGELKPGLILERMENVKNPDASPQQKFGRSKKKVRTNDQYETRNDSSFEDDSEIEGIELKFEETGFPSSKLIMEKEFFSDFNSGLKLKKYIAKKIVQEYTREKHSIPNSMSQLSISKLEPPRAQATQSVGLNATLLGAKSQTTGSLLQVNSNTNKTSEPAKQQQQPTATSDTSGTMGSNSITGTEKKSLLSNIQTNNQAKPTNATGSIFGVGNKTETGITGGGLLSSTQKVSEQKPTTAQGSSGQLNLGNLGQNKVTDASKTNANQTGGLLSQQRPQVQTAKSLLGSGDSKKSGETSTPLFPKGNNQSTHLGKPRSNAEDFSIKEDVIQKKIK